MLHKRETGYRTCRRCRRCCLLAPPLCEADQKGRREENDKDYGPCHRNADYCAAWERGRWWFCSTDHGMSRMARLLGSCQCGLWHLVVERLSLVELDGEFPSLSLNVELSVDEAPFPACSPTRLDLLFFLLCLRSACDRLPDAAGVYPSQQLCCCFSTLSSLVTLTDCLWDSDGRSKKQQERSPRSGRTGQDRTGRQG